MATLVTRTTDQPDGTTAKGSELTHAEVDANFINLNSDKVEVSGAIVFAAKAGEALTKGDVVYVSGVSGNEPVVSKADADDASKMPAFGLAEADANLNAAVNVVTFGTLYDLDTSGFTAGDTVYVSATAGSLTATKPAGESSLIQNIGRVIRSHASAGSIKVGGAGRSNDTPNLNNGNVFIGNSSNQAEARALVEADISDLGTYLTAEADTLDTVTGRGATTSNAVTVGNLTSTGIDDNATSTAITIDSSQNVGIGTTTTTYPLTLQTASNLATIGTVDAGLRLRADGARSVQFYTDSTERVRINSSGDVGIGTASPADELHVNATSANVNLRLTRDTDTGARISGSDGASTPVLKFDTIASGTATERMRIDSSGNVGIGETSPSAPLHVKVTEASTGETDPLIRFERFTSGDNAYLDITVDNSNNLVGFQSTGTNDGGFTFGGASTEHMRITQTGNVGINVANPTQFVEIKSPTGQSAPLFLRRGDASSDAFGPGVLFGNDFSSNGMYLNGAPDNGFRFYTTSDVTADAQFSGTLLMQIDSTGHLYVDKDVVAGNGYGAVALTINDGYGNANLTFNHQNGTPDQNGNAARIEVNVDNSTNAYMHFEGKSNVTSGAGVTLNDMARMYADSGDFHANGNVIAYSTSISDVRLKENVEQVTGALDMLDQIRGVTFDRKDTGRKSAGVIAQELEQVMPYAIYETVLPLKTGSEEDVYKLVEYDALHAVLIEAIKELRAEVEDLKNGAAV